MCPMRVPGTQVSTTETPDGVAIVFTTSGDVAELRARARKMASMHEHMMSGGGEMDSGGMMGSGKMMMTMVPSKARAEDIDGGVRIVITPNDPAQLAALRDHVRRHVEQMKSGECPMMHATR